MQFITDPRTVDPTLSPKFISKSGVDFWSEAIEWRIGMWNHSMLMRKKGLVVWQGWQIVEKPIDLYMKHGVRLDMFSLVDINQNAIDLMNNYINSRMSGPWMSQTYDWLGILGQAIGQTWIHLPGHDYCSVFELHCLRAMVPALSANSSKVIMAQSVESNPQDMHDMYVKNPDVFFPELYYESDEGIILP
jgi:hypothetical protein